MNKRPSYNYRALLKSEYGRRRGRNTSYSLRAYARDLQVSYSRLNEILNGKRGVSHQNAVKLADALALSADERELFLTQIQFEHGRSKAGREIAQQRLEQLLVDEEKYLIQQDVYQIISDWYHYAILELALVKDFKNDLGWISERLGISKTEAEGAVQRLLTLGLLVDEEGVLAPSKTVSLSPSGIPSAAIKKHHEQVLQKAQDAIYLQSIEQRDLSAVMVAVSKKRLPEIQEKIKQFRRSLMKELDQEVDPRDAVYCFSTQLFCLDKSLNEQENL